MNHKHDKPKEREKADGFKVSSLLAVVKRLGYVPYVLVCLGILTALYVEKIPGENPDSIKKFLKLLSAILFVAGILWSLIRLFRRLFSQRPARGLIDGLLCGVIAGFVGGQFGYGSYPTSENPTFEHFHDGSRYLFPTNHVDPAYLRVLWVFVFMVPIAGLMGLGCDLIHNDRKIRWRRDLGIVLLVSTVVLLLVGFGVFRYVPIMQGKGISFSNLGLVFETFLIAFCSIMAWNFGWSWKKFVGRLGIVLLFIGTARMVTFFMATADPAQRGIPLWSRQYFAVEGGDAQGLYELALTVVLFCVWTVAQYSVFYRDNGLTKRIDKWVKNAFR